MSDTEQPIDHLYSCPDCAAAGENSLHPLSEFYVLNVKDYQTSQGQWVRYKGGRRRSAYCRRHQDARTAQNLRERLDPASPRYDAALHARQKASKLKTYNQSPLGQARQQRKAERGISLREAAQQLGVSYETVRKNLSQPITPEAIEQAKRDGLGKTSSD